MRPTTFWNYQDFGSTRQANKELREVLNRGAFSSPKPEKLLQRIIEISTQPGEIVLDYHLGSGTTAAVAHKMGRQYIGIEQMDYIETIAVERLKKVINGEQGGISKSVNWQGGGDFIYFELAQYNQKFVDTIERAKDTKELLTIYRDMQENGFLSYQFDDQAFRERQNEFEALSLDQQKRILMELLDKNMLYLNYEDIEDARYKVDKETIKFNKEIYENR